MKVLRSEKICELASSLGPLFKNICCALDEGHKKLHYRYWTSQDEILVLSKIPSHFSVHFTGKFSGNTVYSMFVKNVLM